MSNVVYPFGSKEADKWFDSIHEDAATYKEHYAKNSNLNLTDDQARELAGLMRIRVLEQTCENLRNAFNHQAKQISEVTRILTYALDKIKKMESGPASKTTIKKEKQGPKPLPF